jgi:hypothetical protein
VFAAQICCPFLILAGKARPAGSRSIGRFTHGAPLQFPVRAAQVRDRLSATTCTGAGHCCWDSSGRTEGYIALSAQSMPPTQPIVRGLFPHGAQRGADVEITVRWQEPAGRACLRFAAPGLSGQILEARHNLIRARVHVDHTAEPGRHDLCVIAPHGSTVAWFDVGTRRESFEKDVPPHMRDNNPTSGGGSDTRFSSKFKHFWRELQTFRGTCPNNTSGW